MRRPVNPSVTVELPSLLAEITGRRTVKVQADTIQRALGRLCEIYPMITGKLYRDSGELRPHLLVFVNETEIRQLAGLSTRLSGNETVLILPAVSGG